MALNGQDSLHLPQSRHLFVSIVAFPSLPILIAPWGQNLRQAPHPAHFD